MSLLRNLLILCLLLGIVEINADRRITRIEIYPSNVTMEANDVVVFTTLAFTHSGTAHTPQAVQWYATGGTMDASGRYTAPAIGGSYTITAMYAGLRAVAQVEVKSFAPTISRIEVIPSTVQLKIGQSYNFNARAYDAYNRPVAFSPTWETTGGGTINPVNGYFYATTYGTYTITARDVASGCFGSATVMIVKASPGIVKIEIFPPKAQVRVFQTCQFTANGYDQYGQPVSITPQWSATGGTIDYNGFYTAGGFPGFYQVVVKDLTSGLQASTQVEIVKGHTPPHSGARIEIVKKDIGGGNFFRPKAKVTIKVYGKDIQSVKMYAVSPDGEMDELKSASCTNETTVYFDPHYDRFSTKWIEIRLYNHMNQVVAKERIEVN